MGWRCQQTVSLAPDCDCYHFLYYKHTVQFVETAVSDHLCHSDLLYRCVSDVLLVQVELWPGWFRFVHSALRYHSECQYLYFKWVQCDSKTLSLPFFSSVVSTILGFIPFMVGAEKEGFWFPLAAGTIGGLVMSVIGVFIFLPVLTLNKKKMMVKKPWRNKLAISIFRLANS